MATSPADFRLNKGIVAKPTGTASQKPKAPSAPLELTGSTPVIELVALRILELASAGESDPDRLTECAVATFEG
jgi:hypothetical protein